MFLWVNSTPTFPSLKGPVEWRTRSTIERGGEEGRASISLRTWESSLSPSLSLTYSFFSAALIPSRTHASSLSHSFAQDVRRELRTLHRRSGRVRRTDEGRKTSQLCGGTCLGNGEGNATNKTTSFNEIQRGCVTSSTWNLRLSTYSEGVRFGEDNHRPKHERFSPVQPQDQGEEEEIIS